MFITFKEGDFTRFIDLKTGFTFQCGQGLLLIEDACYSVEDPEIIFTTIQPNKELSDAIFKALDGGDRDFEPFPDGETISLTETPATK
jgi:hypothetical protein